MEKLENMGVRKNYHRGAAALLLLILTVGGASTLFLPKNILAYTATCFLASNFPTEQQYLDFVRQNEALGGQSMADLKAMFDLPTSGCGDSDWQEFLAAYANAEQKVHEKNAIIEDPNSTPEERAAAIKELGAGYTPPTSVSYCAWYNPGACLRDFRDWLVTAIGFIPAALGGFALTLAGNIFNYFIDHTISQFSGSIVTGKVEEAINIAWTAFRDISNILIIGMFVFIAISLILGIKEYGERKMIARVLIVAVLINFSLLFTKIIIDASNFTAHQFYKAAQISNLTSDQGASTVFYAPPPGIAEKFLRSMGATTTLDLFGVLKSAQESEDGSFVKTIVFGFVIGGLLLLAAIVLLYGAFLMLARAILLIFLMITAPLAFASWLIPKFAHQGWATWWDSLLKSAVFAPLLMALLWVSILLMAGFGDLQGSIGDFAKATDETLPAGEKVRLIGLGTEALFRYIFVLGFLFVSIKLASKFSGTIAGFGGAMTAAVAPFTLSSRLAGGVLRSSVGVGSWFGARRYTKSAGEARDEAARARIEADRLQGLGHHDLAKEKRLEALALQRKAAKRLKVAGQYGALAGSKFNIMDTDAAKSAMSALGISGFAAGASSKSAKSFAGRVEERAKAAEKLATKAAPSAEANDKARELARQQIEAQRKMAHDQRAAQVEAARANANTVQEALRSAMSASQEAETKRSANQNKFDEDIGKRRTVLAEGNKEYKDAQETLAGDERERARINKELSGSERAEALRNQEERIRLARERVTVIENADAEVQRLLRDKATLYAADTAEVRSKDSEVTRLKEEAKRAQDSVRDAQNNLSNYETETNRLVQEAQKDIVEAMRDSAVGIAGIMGEKQGDILTRAIGTVTFENRAVREETKSLYKKKRNEASFRSVVQSVLNEEKGGESSAGSDSKKS